MGKPRVIPEISGEIILRTSIANAQISAHQREPEAYEEVVRILPERATKTNFICFRINFKHEILLALGQPFASPGRK